MIRNYIKIAFRNLWKERTFTALNIIGLTAAFGVAFLLSMYALFELSADQFHVNKDTVYQIYTDEETPKGTESNIVNPIPFAKALQTEVPGIKKITRYMGGGPSISFDDKVLRLGAIWVDPDFFDIFSFPVARGEKVNPISQKSSIAITQKSATRLFGDEDPLNKTVLLQQNGSQIPVTISAILEDYPISSSFNFEAVLNFTSLPDYVYANNIDRWDNFNHEVYVQLDQGISQAQFEGATRPFSALHFADDISNVKRDGAQTNANGDYRQIKLLPFTDNSFVSVENGILTVSKTLEYLILGIAILILFIASVNFINMSIAKGSQRLREIGMRKTLGAGKAQLFFQFWGESLLIFLTSAFLGSIVAMLLLKPFQDLFRTNASFASITSTALIVGLIVIFLCITFIAGGYPAYLMSKLSTLQALKGKLETQSRNRVRNVLMVLQFSIAIVLISGTLVLWNQLEFMRSKDLGFNKEQVISIPIGNTADNAKVLRLLRNELENQTNIVSISASSNILGFGRDQSSSTSVTGFEHQGREIKTNMLMVDYDYPETLDMEVVTGRTFNRSYISDTLSVMINEAMAQQFTEENPLDIIIDLEEFSKFKVIGVLKDFHFQDLDKSIAPLSLFMNKSKRVRYAYVRVAPDNLEQSYNQVEKAWNRIEPDRQFLGSFLDENIDRTLRKERMMTTMISSGSILAIILSCIGLFAISLLVVTQRRKEIGIRKVVGASVRSITILLTADFLKLVCIAFVIATPIAWWAVSQWLQNYIYKIDVSIWTFIAAGAIALIIAAITISARTLAAAVANPVKSLKTE